ncbi:MAG: radical SAM protein [Phycisphaerae bacterium]|nr:radical SAM protein [Phycisphaerae bacterium]
MNNIKKSGSSREKTRILFTTACENAPYEYISTNIADSGHNLRFERRISFGLRFLQANIPEITILEYPSRKEYLRVLSLGWDVVGYSFYANEIPIIHKMVSAARRLNVAELWGGNYGVITPEAAALFDRVFYGYSEGQIAKSLGISQYEFIHPPLITHFCFGKGLGLLPVGILFTQRGCNRNCTFCQTPVFCGRTLNPISLESIKRVINAYRRLRVGAILILDECFGALPRQSDSVTLMLRDSALPWLPMTRVDILDRNLTEWADRGMFGALLGIEAFRGDNLESVRKTCGIEKVLSLINRMHVLDLIAIGFFMIGFENDTEASLQEDLRQLESLKLDIVQVCILTPFHGTSLYQRLSEKYGIDESDLSKFDGKNLVWNHPHFSRSCIEQKLREFFQVSFPPAREIETMKRYARRVIKSAGMEAGLSFLAGSFLRANVV